MKEFDKLQSIWKNQHLGTPPDFDLSRMHSKLAKLKREERFTPIMLATTIAVLMVFLFMQPEEYFDLLKYGILLMSFALLVRILFEIWGISMLKKMVFTEEVNLFFGRLARFDRTRKLIHFIITPILFLIYLLAFYSLLPVFKLNLSAGMYNYVVWSSVVIFGVLILIKLFSIPKELKALKELKIQVEGLVALREM